MSKFRYFGKRKMAARVMGIMMAATISFAYVGDTAMHVSADTKSEAQSKKAQAEAEKASVQAELKEFDTLKGNAQEKLDAIDKELTDVATKVQELKKKCSAKKTEIAKTQKKLKKAEASEKEQYKDMKLRIQFMYENGQTEYASMLLSASSITDFLNKAEYISKITDYDTKMLKKYQETKRLIATSKEKLEKDYAKLKKLQSEQEAKMENLQTLSKKKTAEISAINRKITKGKNKVAGYDASIASSDNILKEIAVAEAAQRQERESREAAEEASRQAAAQAAASNNSGSSSNNSSNNSSSNSSSSSNSGNSSGGAFNDTPSNAGSSSAGFTWPLPGAYHSMSTEYGVSDAFGNPGHCGVDYPAPSGTPIYAVSDGTVTMASFTSGTGNCVIINHGNGLESVYMHLSAYNSSAGQRVSKGQVIGYVGTTGPSTGNHLHMSFRLNG